MHDMYMRMIYSDIKEEYACRLNINITNSWDTLGKYAIDSQHIINVAIIMHHLYIHIHTHTHIHTKVCYINDMYSDMSNNIILENDCQMHHAYILIIQETVI